MTCPRCGIEVPVRYCPKCGRDCQKFYSDLEARVREEAAVEAELAKQRSLVVPSFSQFVGQPQSVRRLQTFGDFYVSRGATPEHILLTGDEGLGKSRLARAFAKAYTSGLRESSAESFERKGDLTAEITSIQPGNAWIVHDIHMLRRPMLEIFRVALQEFRLGLVIGEGPGSRVHSYELNRFTCIAIAPEASSVQVDLLKCFSLPLQLQPYGVSDLESIANALAAESGIVLGQGAGRLIANVSEGNPAALERFIKRFARFGKSPVTAEDAAQALAALGLNSSPVMLAADSANAERLDFLTGAEFEKVVTGLLQRLGFQAEMTRATGDGGIDIVAHLRTPLVGGRYLIQCKRFADNPVGAPMIREFYGAVVADRNAIKGIFITTSVFTEQAKEFAQHLPLELIDGNQLKQLLANSAASHKIV